MNDDIQRAHLIAQQNEGVGGPYLALLSSSDSRRIQREIFCMQRCIDEKVCPFPRREGDADQDCRTGDYWNSKYCFSSSLLTS